MRGDQLTRGADNDSPFDAGRLDSLFTWTVPVPFVRERVLKEVFTA